ncbi:MAG: HAD hydrolase-like protein, partial [Gammaproteobacteria bacterium]|nr:HAD hydrolase-like protein [Gammaproteobacteria bacterium]
MNILFDFDGTLINSHTKAIELYNQSADNFNIRKIQPDEIETLKNLNSKDLVKYLGIPFYKVPQILLQVRKLLKNEMLSLEPIPNIQEIIKQLHTANFHMGILTSNSLENVHSWLRHHDMEQYFSFVHAESSYFGKGRLIKKLLKKHYIPSSHAWYVGDETRDIE